MATRVKSQVKRLGALDLYLGTSSVVGQDPARMKLATLLERQIDVFEGIWERSSGAIIAGASGVGKTHLVRMMCRLSGLPFAEVNATQYTESGYSGDDLTQMFLPLLEAAARMYDEKLGRNLDASPAPGDEVPFAVLKRPASELKAIREIAQRGVILLDEFDKWMKRFNHVTGKKDDLIQTELLKMIEGSVEWVSDDDDEAGIMFDSTRVLVLCAGAFLGERPGQGLVDQVARRLNSLTPTNPAFWDMILPEDFIRYGLIPELAGRLSQIIYLRPLTPDHLSQIMLAPGGTVEEYRRRFEERGVRWDVSAPGLRYLADQAKLSTIGARGLDHEMHHHFSEALFQATVREGNWRVTFNVNSDKAQLEPA